MTINRSGLVQLINSMIKDHETVSNIPEEERVFLDETDGKIKPYRWKQLDYNIHANGCDQIHVSMFELFRRIGIHSYEDAVRLNLNGDNE